MECLNIFLFGYLKDESGLIWMIFQGDKKKSLWKLIMEIKKIKSFITFFDLIF